MGRGASGFLLAVLALQYLCSGSGGWVPRNSPPFLPHQASTGPSCHERVLAGPEPRGRVCTGRRSDCGRLAALGERGGRPDTRPSGLAHPSPSSYDRGNPNAKVLS